MQGGPHEIEGLKMQKWNTRTDRAQRGIKKWGNLSGYHVTSRVMVMKMANFLYFLPMTVLTKYFSAPERSSGNCYG